jgi:P27 family predicted phage terminase small subunit
MSGPPPKPTALRMLEGNPSRRPLNDAEPKPKAQAPKCPAWLHVDAKREWRRLAPKLEALGLLTEVDGTALAAYCQAYARWKEAEEVIEREGLTFTMEKTGYTGPRPEVAISRQSVQIMKAFCAEFGLTPASRSRLRAAPPEEKDPFEDFLSGRSNA